MGKFIAFGKYNKLYKYLWIYIAIRVVNEYFFGTSFPNDNQRRLNRDLYIRNYKRIVFTRLSPTWETSFLNDNESKSFMYIKNDYRYRL